MLAFASCTRHPLRNAVMVLLSAKAGLRAGEIANLTWDMVVDANGHISGLIELTDNAAKKCQNSQGSTINYAIRLIHAVCGLAGSPTLMDEIRADLRNFGTFRVACLTSEQAHTGER